MPVTAAQPRTIIDITVAFRSVQRGCASPEQVRLVQERLNAHGAQLTVDGKFGPKTEHAVRAFQHQHSIGGDARGVVGSTTLRALNRDEAPVRPVVRDAIERGPRTTPAPRRAAAPALPGAPTIGERIAGHATIGDLARNGAAAAEGAVLAVERQAMSAGRRLDEAGRAVKRTLSEVPNLRVSDVIDNAPAVIVTRAAGRQVAADVSHTAQLASEASAALSSASAVVSRLADRVGAWFR